MIDLTTIDKIFGLWISSGLASKSVEYMTKFIQFFSDNLILMIKDIAAALIK